MGGIFGFTLLNNNKMGKDSIITLTTELLKSQLGPTEEINIAITTSENIHVIKTNMSIPRFIATKEFKEFMHNALKDITIYSLIGSFKDKVTYKEFLDLNDEPMVTFGEVVCVQKEKEFTDVDSGGVVVAEIFDRYEFAIDLTTRIKTAAKDVKLYAAVHAAYPSCLLIAKHTADPLELCMFAQYGVFIFSSISKSVDKVTQLLLLGKRETVEMFSYQAFLLNMSTNTYKVINSYSGNVNYAIK